MKKMNLDQSKEKQQVGKEIPGMIAIYVVQMPDGDFYVGESEDSLSLKTTQYWHKAKFMFLLTGLMKARRIAAEFGGKVCIINCTQVTEYQD